MTWAGAFHIDSSAAIVPQFRDLADALLHRAVLVAGETRYRFTEIEFYYKGGGHPDPFTHGDELQLTSGRWYFHRRGGTYVGGSFKGLDITLGDGVAHGGMLIRGLQVLDGPVVDGPCRCVEALLAATGYTHVRELDQALGDRVVWGSDAVSARPLDIQPIADLSEREIFYTGRVGLTLKRYTADCDKERYLMAPYRALTTPRATKKGRVYLITALHRSGRDASDIRALTGSPMRTVEEAIARFQAGFERGEFAPYIDRSLNTGYLATLHGIWSRWFG